MSQPISRRVTGLHPVSEPSAAVATRPTVAEPNKRGRDRTTRAGHSTRRVSRRSTGMALPILRRGDGFVKARWSFVGKRPGSTTVMGMLGPAPRRGQWAVALMHPDRFGGSGGRVWPMRAWPEGRMWGIPICLDAGWGLAGGLLVLTLATGYLPAHLPGVSPLQR